MVAVDSEDRTIQQQLKTIGGQSIVIARLERQNDALGESYADCRKYFLALAELETALLSGATGEQLEEIQGRVSIAHERAKKALGL
jgi:hypothetical protein